MIGNRSNVARLSKECGPLYLLSRVSNKTLLVLSCRNISSEDKGPILSVRFHGNCPVSVYLEIQQSHALGCEDTVYKNNNGPTLDLLRATFNLSICLHSL